MNDANRRGQTLTLSSDEDAYLESIVDPLLEPRLPTGHLANRHTRPGKPSKLFRIGREFATPWHEATVTRDVLALLAGVHLRQRMSFWPKVVTG